MPEGKRFFQWISSLIIINNSYNSPSLCTQFWSSSSSPKTVFRRSGWNQGMPRCDLKSVTSRRFRPIICIVEAKNVQMMSSQCWATIGNHVLHIIVFWTLVVDWLIMCHSTRYLRLFSAFNVMKLIFSGLHKKATLKMSAKSKCEMFPMRSRQRCGLLCFQARSLGGEEHPYHFLTWLQILCYVRNIWSDVKQFLAFEYIGEAHYKTH